MRIFIVDDEEISCRGLSGMIGRILGPDGNEIYTFTSSVEALEQADLLRPDVIFIDIIMPELSGIDFTEKIQEVYSPEIIVISGNDDYNYVRRCFKLNVRDYLLKPIEFSELKNFIEKMNNDFIEDKENEPDIDIMSLPFVFNAIVKSNDISDEFKLSVCGIESLDSVCGTVKVKKEKEQYGDFVFTFYLSHESDYDAVVECFIRCFENLAKESSTVCKAAYTALYSTKEAELAKTELFEVFKSRFYSEDSMCYSSKNRVYVEENDNSEFFQELSRLPHFLSFEDGAEYRIFIKNWFVERRLSKLPYETIKRQYDATVERLINSSDFEDDLEIKNFKDFNTIGELIFEINRVADGILNYYLELNQNDKNVIELALKYINDNYQKNITLATVSNYYNLNYSYFSRIFKEFIGIPFSQYLLKIRMDKARELLISNPDFKISDIAKLVGYSGDNVQNFTRAFKNHFGKPPKNYKN